MTGNQKDSERGEPLWALASHDLRQPVQGLLLLVKALEMSGKAETRPITDRMAASIDSLGTMLEVITDLARFEAGSKTPIDTRFDLIDVLQQTCRHLSTQIGINIRLTTPNGISVLGNRHLTGQLLAGSIGAIAERAQQPIDVTLEGGRLVISALATNPLRESAFVVLPCSGEALSAITVPGLRLLERLAAALGITFELSQAHGKASVTLQFRSTQQMLAECGGVSAVAGTERTK